MEEIDLKNIEFYEETEFKETEIGPLPKDWQVVRLGEVIKFRIGKTPSRNKKEYWNNGKYYWVSISDMQNQIINKTNEMVSEYAHKEIFKEKLVPSGTLLMSFKLTIGRTAILNVNAYHNEAIISIYPTGKVLKEFLFFYLPFINYSNFQDKAVKGNTLNSSKIQNIPIPLPSLIEQKNISYILSIIQEAKEKTERVIEATKNLKKSLMKHLFTYGPVPLSDIDKVELKETEIGLIPKDWEVVRLEYIVEKMKAGGTPSTNISEYWNGDIPLVKVEDVVKSNKFLFSTNLYITNKGLENSNAWLVPENSIILTMYGTPGEVCINKIPVAVTQNVMGIVKNEKITIEFFYYVLKFAKIYTLHLITDRTIFTHFTLSKAKNLKFPLPPISEQQKIAEILSSVDEKVQKEEERKRALENLFKSMLHNLMTGKIRVRSLNLKG